MYTRCSGNILAALSIVRGKGFLQQCLPMAERCTITRPGAIFERSFTLWKMLEVYRENGFSCKKMGRKSSLFIRKNMTTESESSLIILNQYSVLELAFQQAQIKENNSTVFLLKPERLNSPSFHLIVNWSQNQHKRFTLSKPRRRADL